MEVRSRASRSSDAPAPSQEGSLQERPLQEPAAGTLLFTLNGEPRSERAPLTIDTLLTRLDLGSRRVAVAVNAAVVARSRFAQVEIRSGDHVEVIHAVGGG